MDLRETHKRFPGLLRMCYPDTQIAAIALAHGLTLVTRNMGDFPGVSTLNPWGEYPLPARTSGENRWTHLVSLGLDRRQQRWQRNPAGRKVEEPGLLCFRSLLALRAPVETQDPWTGMLFGFAQQLAKNRNGPGVGRINNQATTA